MKTLSGVTPASSAARMQRHFRRLITRPHVDAAGGNDRRGIAGLHAGMSEIGHRISRLDHFGGLAPGVGVAPAFLE